jgi:hypothetical protein
VTDALLVSEKVAEGSSLAVEGCAEGSPMMGKAGAEENVVWDIFAWLTGLTKWRLGAMNFEKPCVQVNHPSPELENETTIGAREVDEGFME